MNARTTRQPPGPSSAWFGIPLLRAMARDYLGFVQGLQRTHGDVVHMRLGVEKTDDIFAPELVREVLVNQARHFIRWERGIEVFAQSHGQSVLITEGEPWHRQRQCRLLQLRLVPRGSSAAGLSAAGAARGSGAAPPTAR